MEKVNRLKFFLVLVMLGGALGLISNLIKQILEITPNTTFASFVGSIIVVGGTIIAMKIIINSVNNGKLSWLIKSE